MPPFAFARTSVFLLFAAAAGLSGCAAISSPEGGVRDTIPPKLTRSVPANGTRNYQGQSVRLEFSEQVQLKDLAKNLIVAPIIGDDNPYKIREERTAITLTYEKPLKANTTYSFNFGNSISDITESNPAAKAIVSFSTGPDLDSASVRGTVQAVLSQQPVENAVVLLYPEADTSTVQRGRPTYLARTDKAGRFELNYLKAARYRAYALLDKNQNNRYEEPEQIAYLPDLLTVDGRTDSVRFLLTRPDTRRPLVTTQKTNPTDFRVSYNEGVQQLTLAPLGAATAPAGLNDALQLTEKGRTAILYRTPQLQEGRFLLTATDSAGNTGRDTIAVRFQGNPPTKRGIAYTVEGSPKEVYRQGQVKFVFTEPVVLTPGKPIGTLLEDSLKRRPLQLPADGQLGPDRSTLSINLNTTARKTVTLLLDSAVVRSITGQSLGLKPLRLRVTEQTSTGTLSGPIQTTAKRFWVQLLDAAGNIQLVLDSPKGNYRFDNLPPGTYRIRILIDTNQDGRWQGGDPQLRRPAEPVFLFPKTIQVRSNFDNVETLSF
ncbi:Ig-like domain-containing protein [Hymenobacter endophyticus]|uniref:Ig-like domain-containing protein n=1 Tax=Hymenobacter endophyticus TaxID=3076335 RepID=A0ABU3TLV9_9BACT|nr:Ig-like domain-containing protein [Hymenobacter endophyticus]MDU0372165.1 Ig-like domain-containing protein [Hymenobacter endophyticus]